MKGKLISAPDFYPEKEMIYSLLRKKEYLILGISDWGYWVYNELSEINLAPIDKIEITDNRKPDFWVKGKTNEGPKEWLWENYLSLDGEPYLEIWDYEIWSVTQFAKGFYHYDFPLFPINFRRAVDTDYKIDIINAYLKMCGEFDCLTTGDYYGEYTFSKHKAYENMIGDGSEKYYKRLLQSNTMSGFEVLSDVLKGIGENLIHSKLVLSDKDFLSIRNRILLSIWSLFGTKDFTVYQLEYIGDEANYDKKPYYTLEDSKTAYCLSYYWST